MPFSVGENVGAYRIIEQLGQGGMATVLKAYHASLDRYVALKVLHPAFGEDPAFEARFQREARVVARLEHPNIVPIYDYAEHENRPYLVMKFIEGETLKAKLDKGPLSSEEILEIVDAVGSALSYAHKQSVLHRDIKPSNVLVAADGQVYLADFGLARIAQLGESTLSGDMIIGTPQYISPEQAMGVKDLDERTDVYSFGVMLYEMVVGKVPFNADTPFSIIHDHIYSPLPLPRKVNPNVFESVERVLLKSLAKNRLDRYENVDQMVSAFRDAWTQAVIPTQTAVATRTTIQQAASQPPAPAAQPKLVLQSSGDPAPRKKRSRWVWVGVGLLLLCCLSFTVRAFLNRLSGPATPDVEPTSLTPGMENNLPLDVVTALRELSDDPNDPDLQLALAMIYWQSDMPEEAYATLQELIRQARPEDGSFYHDAGNDFLLAQAWTPAAMLYLQAVKMQADNGEIAQDLLVVFHEAVYKSADRAETLRVLPVKEIAQVDEPIALILKARSAYFAKDFEQAYSSLEEAKQLQPNMHEATLLEAEFESLDGESERAKILLLGLQELDAVPEWIRIFAEEILKRLP